MARQVNVRIPTSTQNQLDDLQDAEGLGLREVTIIGIDRLYQDFIRDGVHADLESEGGDEAREGIINVRLADFTRSQAEALMQAASTTMTQIIIDAINRLHSDVSQSAKTGHLDGEITAEESLKAQA